MLCSKRKRETILTSVLLQGGLIPPYILCQITLLHVMRFSGNYMPVVIHMSLDQLGDTIMLYHNMHDSVHVLHAHKVHKNDTFVMIS